MDAACSHGGILFSSSRLCTAGRKSANSMLYSSQIEINNEAITGPIKIPGNPNITIPPKLLKKISSSCIRVSLPTKIGRRTLSRLPTIKLQNNANPIPMAILPCVNKITTAGIHTKAAPILGIAANIAISEPQNTAFGIPATAKAIPASAPCNKPISKEPFSVARVTEVNLSSIIRSSAVLSGK